MSKLTLREKLGYSAGEIGSTISWQGMMFFLGFFIRIFSDFLPSQPDICCFCRVFLTHL